MRMRINRIVLLKIFLLLVLINYMVVTIILDDVVILKYLRDLLIICMLLLTFRTQIVRIKYYPILMLFCLCVLFSSFHATSAKAAIIASRRYLIPLIMYYIAFSMGSIHSYKSISKYLLTLLAILSIWGIFQAYILGDSFLKNIGYPQVYNIGYGRMMLPNAFYFGNLGIQRVASTLASPNIYALILGLFIISALLNQQVILHTIIDIIEFLIILLAYILTFSRSNFFAAIIVAVIFIYPHLKNRQMVLALVAIGCFIVATVGFIQGEDGIVYKLYIWANNSIHFKELSAAGRSSRWAEAFYHVSRNPFGIGPGHVGSIATNVGISGLYMDVENSYLCLALDTGWIGSISYYTFLLCLFCQSKKRAEFFKTTDKQLFLLNMTSKTILLYLAIVMFFSNHVQDMEAMVFAFMYLGLIDGISKRSEIIRGELK